MATEISAVMQTINGSSTEWSLLEIPIPAGMLVYSNDDQIFKLGDGVSLYDDLSIFFDAKIASSLQEFKDSFPILTENDVNKLLIVNPQGTGFIISEFTTSDLVTLLQLTSALSTKADINHTHTVAQISGLKSASLRNVGTLPGEVPEVLLNGKLDPSIVPVVDETSINRDDVLSWLIMKQQEEDNISKLALPNGYADEFVDESGIDLVNSNNITYDSVNQTYSVTEGKLVSLNTPTDVLPTSVRLFGRIESDLLENIDIQFEVSRDDGANWAHVPVKESVMSTDTIKIYSGDSTFSEVNASSEIDLYDFVVYDYKGSITSFTVDTPTTGHFNNIINDKIVVGSIIKINEHPLVITSITGTGVEQDSISFVGIITPALYQVEAITSLNVGNVDVGVEGDIEILANIPSNIKQHCSVIYGGALYVFGGFDGTDILNTTYKYTFATNLWETKEVVPDFIRSASAVIYNDKIYLVGGYTNVGNTNTIYIYDPVANTWTLDTAVLSNATRNHKCLIYNDKLYIFGGFTTALSHDVKAYDLVNLTWEDKANMPLFMDNFGMIVDNDIVYVIGGNDVNGSLNTLYTYDLINDTWDQLATLPDGLRYVDGFIYENFIYVVGGENSGVKDVVYRYQISTNIWDVRTVLPNDTQHHSVHLYEGLVYVIGGDDGTAVLNSLYTYSLTTPIDGIYTNTTASVFSAKYDIDKSNINSMKQIKLAELLINDSISCALQFGDDYKIFKNNTWKTIAKLSGTTYQYLNEEDVFVNSNYNNLDDAISESVKIFENKMSIDQLASLDSDKYESIPDSLIITINSSSDPSTVVGCFISATSDFTFPEANNIKWQIVANTDQEIIVHGISINWN